MSLLTSLVSYWKMDAASNGEPDAHGANALVQTGSVGTAAGKIGTCRSFPTGNYFGLAASGNLNVGNSDFTIAFWVQFTAAGQTTANAGFLGSYGEYGVWYESPPSRFRFGSGGGNTITANNFGVPSVGAWHHVVCWHDSVNDVLAIQVDNGTPDTMAFSIGFNVSTYPFSLGTWPGFANANGQYLDEVGFWSRVLTPAERTQLYADGAGLAYPFAAAVIAPVYYYQHLLMAG